MPALPFDTAVKASPQTAGPTRVFRVPPARRRLLAATGLFVLAGLPGVGLASDYPSKAVTLVVPNAAGGAADNLARGFADELARRLGQPVVVENLGGASGALAAQRVLRAAPDGYTLLFGTTSDMVVTPIANPKAGYATSQFTPIVKVGRTPMTLVARPGLGVKTVDELVAMARGKPGGLTVGTTGNASLQAFAKEALQRAAGVELLGIPYKGGAPMMNDLLGGQLDLAVLTLPAVIGQVRADKVVMLGLLSGERAASAPEMPTVNESKAVSGVSVEIWAALAGPSGLPAAVVSRISSASKEVLEDQAFTARRAKMGDIAVPWASPADFGAYLKAQEATYRTLATGLKLQ